jgi:hypothetical protein
MENMFHFPWVCPRIDFLILSLENYMLEVKVNIKEEIITQNIILKNTFSPVV